MIPRPQTTRSTSNKDKISDASVDSHSNDENGTTNITIIQVSSPIAKDKFIFPPIEECGDDEKYKSNVQIIPSNYNPPPTRINEAAQISNVEVSSVVSSRPEPIASTIIGSVASVPVIPVRSIPVGENFNDLTSFGPVTNVPIVIEQTPSVSVQQHYEQVFVTPSTSSDAAAIPPKVTFLRSQQKSASQIEMHVNRINLSNVDSQRTATANNEASSINISAGNSKNQAASTSTIEESNSSKNVVLQREPPSMVRRALTRGLTEAVLRPSRKDGVHNSQPKVFSCIYIKCYSSFI